MKKIFMFLLALLFLSGCEQATPTMPPTASPQIPTVTFTATVAPTYVLDLSADIFPASIASPTPTEIPTARPIHPEDYQGWWTYTHPTYNFSIMLPPDWIVDETTGNNALLNGHVLMLHTGKYRGEGTEGLQVRMSFRRVGEDVPLGPTGVGAGQFIQQGTLDVAGQPARRMLFICPIGQVQSIWYQGSALNNPNIQRSDMEFGFILSLTGFYCEDGHSLSGKTQYLGEMIIASLSVP